MFLHVLLLLLSSLFIASIDYPPVSGNVQNSGADFTWHSQLEKMPDNKFQIINYIKNNSSIPLSVKWEDGGFAAIGFKQIEPGQTDRGKITGTVTDKPYLLQNSPIKYGVNLSNTTPGQVYVVPKSSSKGDAKTRTTEYERRDVKGEILFKIEVASTMSRDQLSAKLTITVTGRLNLILSSKIGAEIKYLANNQDRQLWEATVLDSSRDLRRQVQMYPYTRSSVKPTLDFIESWLKETSFSGSAPRTSGLMFLDAPSYGRNELTVMLRGDKWSLSKLYLVGITPNEAGAVGVVADVYLPK